MQETSYRAMMDQQREFFYSGKTLPVTFRIHQLKKLKRLLETHENEIIQALKLDLNKAPLEAIVNEVVLVTKEIDFVIKHLAKWMQAKKASTPFPLWPGSSRIHYEPYGCTLIIGPWNYPFMLVLSPLVGAISAGNCAVIKPSEVSPHTQDIIVNLINSNFEPQYIKAIAGGPEDVNALLVEKFDYIFFTGGTQIGKIIMAAAANHLTPITLELGGKSPCIVDETADLNYAARRIAWAKTTNAGQVCISPDFLYVHESCKDELIDKLKKVLLAFYGEDPEKSQSYGRIINKKHYLRLIKLMHNGNIIFGGQANEDTLYIAPTIIDELTWNDPIMQEEVFGPLLPILTYTDLSEVIQLLKQRPKPLAFYLFTKDKEIERHVLKHLPFGGGCINDCIMHITNLNLPFGGVGLSGMGHYHGWYSFETFSHQKSVYKKNLPLDLKIEYPPYTDRKLKWLRRLLKF